VVTPGRLKRALIDSWNELVLDDFTVLFPVFSILHAASLKVTTAAMNKDDEEEDWVEVGNWRSKANREPPGE